MIGAPRRVNTTSRWAYRSAVIWSRPCLRRTWPGRLPR